MKTSDISAPPTTRMIDSWVFGDRRFHSPCPDALLQLSTDTRRPRTDCPQLLQERIGVKDSTSHAAMHSGKRKLLNAFIEAQFKAEHAGKRRPATGPS